MDREQLERWRDEIDEDIKYFKNIEKMVRRLATAVILVLCVLAVITLWPVI